MAEVFGTLAGQDIELNNAATEATLKQLVNAVGILAAKQGKDIKSQKQLEAELKKFHTQLDKAGKNLNKLTKEQEEEIKKKKQLRDAIDEEEEARRKSQLITVTTGKALVGLANAVEGSVSKLAGFMGQLAGMGNSFSSAAGAFGSIPLVGGLLSTVFGSIAASGDRVYNSFRQAATVGANFNGSIRTMIDSASGAGLTIDQFSAIIAKNGENLAMLGGSTSTGAKRLADLGKTIRNSALGDELARLGYNTEEINSGMATYGGRLARIGALQGMSNAQLVKSTGEYLKNLDAVSKLTGKNKEALEAEAQARMNDAQFRTMIAKLGDDGKNLEALLATLPPGLQKGAKEVLATGTATSEAGIQFLQLYPKAAATFTKAGQEARQSGKFSREAAEQLYGTVATESKSLAKSPISETLGNFNDAYNDVIVGTYDLAGRQKTFADVTAEQAKGLADAGKRQQDALDPASMKRFQESIAVMSNQITKLLAENMPMLQSAFSKLAGFVNDTLIPVFKWVMTHFEDIVKGLVAFKLATIATGMAMKALEFYRLLKGPGTPTNPAHVIVRNPGALGGGADLDGAGPDGPDKGKGGKGKGGKLGKLGKGLLKPGATAILGLGASMAGEYATEQGYEKTGAALDVGGEALTWGGTGAMIGSVVPGVGTAIGGAVGAVGGAAYGLYKNWGTVTGSKNTVPATAKVDPKLANDYAWSVYSSKMDLSQIPENYRDSVGKILEKPPAHWAKALAAQQAPAGGGGTGPTAPEKPSAQPASAKNVNYNTADSGSLLVQFAKQQNSKFVSPDYKASVAMNEAEQKKRAMEADANKAKEEAEKRQKELEKSTEEIKDKKPGPIQDSSETLLANLNTNMAELIKINKQTVMLNERQLTVQQSMTNNLFVA